MNTVIREYRHAASSLLRGRGFTFVALLTLGLGAGSVAVISQAGGAVLRPVSHALGLSKAREQCSHINQRAQKRRPIQAVAAILPQQSASAEAPTNPGG